MISAERPEPIDISFVPQGRHPALPVEVLTRSELMARRPASHRQRPQRADFHVLVLCTTGEGSHDVDFVEYRLARGSVVRIRPGQIQQSPESTGFGTISVIWRAEHHPEQAGRPPWFPGGPDPVAFELPEPTLARVEVWLKELCTEQDRFNGSTGRIEIMRSILRALLLLIDEHSGFSTARSVLPQPYLDLRELLEHDLYDRPSVASLAGQLGYSTRTLDRACQAVTGKTAKKTIDERMGLELRRLLADDRMTIAQVGGVFGYREASNFARFVRRIVGRSPGELRSPDS